ncbi:MAG: DUF4167 domain-containing protein [Alphaproteobacteria bacterium]|nr:DUF4167 domain-containing protein [Alphaproteobacteria bacterium]
MQMHDNKRQGQGMKRSRGRGRHKPQNNSNRTLESNGPDVKIRGNSQHIYEKYQQLARDANATGDRVMAENYLQHAEHYYRVIVAAQGALQASGQSGQNGSNGRHQGGGFGDQEAQSGFPGLPGSAFGNDEGEDSSANEEDSEDATA